MLHAYMFSPCVSIQYIIQTIISTNTLYSDGIGSTHPRTLLVFAFIRVLTITPVEWRENQICCPNFLGFLEGTLIKFYHDCMVGLGYTPNIQSPYCLLRRGRGVFVIFRSPHFTHGLTSQTMFLIPGFVEVCILLLKN